MSQAKIEPNETKARPAESGLTSRLNLLVVLMLVNAGIGAAGRFFPPSASTQTEAGVAHAAGDLNEGQRPVPASTLRLEPFLVNLADEGKHRYVKATFHVGFAERAAASAAAEQPAPLSLIRQTVIDALGGLHAEDVVTAEGKQRLRSDLRDKLNRQTLPARVVDVYITDFLVQY